MFAEVVFVQQVLFDGRTCSGQAPASPGPCRRPPPGRRRSGPTSAASLPQANGAWLATSTPGIASGSRSAKRSTITWPVLQLVGLFDLLLRERPGDRHRAVEVVGVRRAEAGDLAAGLGESGRLAAVRVRDAADALELLVQHAGASACRRRASGRPRPPRPSRGHHHHLLGSHAGRTPRRWA